MKFVFLNILKTKCNSVREREMFTLFHTLLHLVLKISKKKKLHFDKKYLMEQFEIFHKCMHPYLKNK